MWNVDLLEQGVWAEISWILDDYKDMTYGLLLDKYENSKADRGQQIAKLKANIEKCKRERQTVLRQVRKGNINQAVADTEFIVINKDEADWQQDLDNLIVLDTKAESAIDSFIEQVKAVNMQFDYGFNPTPEQKKQILNLLLDKFILHPDGKIELRFKMPVNEKQVAESIRELSCNVLVF